MRTTCRRSDGQRSGTPLLGLILLPCGLNNEEPYASTCTQILEKARKNSVDLVISPMTMAETVRPRGASAPIPIEHQERITDFFENDYMRFRIIDRLIAKRSLGLCWNAGLHPRDALHVAVALEEGCDALETRDGKLLRSNGLEGLTIREPFWESQTDVSDD